MIWNLLNFLDLDLIWISNTFYFSWFDQILNNRQIQYTDNMAWISKTKNNYLSVEHSYERMQVWIKLNTVNSSDKRKTKDATAVIKQLKLNQKFYCSKQLKVNQKFYCNKQLKVNQRFYCNKHCAELIKEKDCFLQQSWINHLFKREIRTAWCQQPSERDEGEEEGLYRAGRLYRQARTSPRCWVLPPGGLYGCTIPTYGSLVKLF